MKLPGSSWLTDLAAIGNSFIEVLKAEFASLSGDLSASGKALLRGVAILAAAAVLVGWVVILLSLALIAYLEQYMEPWLAILVVAGLVLLVAIVLFVWGRSSLSQFTPPTTLVRTHVEGHVEWLQDQLQPTSELAEDRQNELDRA